MREIVIKTWRALVNLGKALKVLSLFFPGILAVLVCYFILVGMDEGQDILIQFSELASRRLFGVVALIFWGFTLWYSSRLVGYCKAYAKEPTPLEATLHLHIPRLLGYNVFIAVQAAVLTIPTIGILHCWVFWLFIAIQNCWFFFYTYAYGAGKLRWKLLAVSMVPIILYSLFLGNIALRNFRNDPTILEYASATWPQGELAL